MSTIRLHLLFALLFLTYNSIAQDNSPAAKHEIKLVHSNGILPSRKILPQQQVKIWIVEENEPISGFITYADQNTIAVDDREIPVKHIEKLRVTKVPSLVVGGIFAAGGLVLAAQGRSVYKNAAESPCVGGGCIFGLLGGATAMAAGTASVVCGTIVLATSTNKYNMDKWHFHITNE